MNFQTPDTYYFIACYTHILTAFISALMYTHMCPPYRNYAYYFYPARKVMIAILSLMGILELPYLLDIESSEATYYAAMFGILFYPPASSLGLERYFFFRPFRSAYVVRLVIPSAFLILLALANVWCGGRLLSGYKTEFNVACYLVYAVQMAVLLRTIRRMQRKLKKMQEMQYSNHEDFPVQFAQRWMLVPLVWGVFILYVSINGGHAMLMARDTVISILCMALISTALYPHRTNFPNQGEEDISRNINEEIEKETQAEISGSPKDYKLNEAQRMELEENIISVIREQELFKKTNLRLGDITGLVKTNESYAYEAISRGKYGSFYNLVNYMRVEYCKEQLRMTPNIRQDDLALMAGFNSRTTFWRAFKFFAGTTPSKWKYSDEMGQNDASR